MATDALRHRARQKNAAVAAKKRRERIMLVTCVILLVGLVALEGPKTLRKLHSSSPAPAPATTIPQPSGAGATTPTSRPVDMRALRNYAAKDPFVAQIAAAGAALTPAPTRVVPPRVRTAHFVAKDPFVQQVTIAAPAQTPKVSSKAPLATTGGNLIVIVASVPVGQGRAAADKAAAQARSHGVPNVHVVLSSSYPTLRSGFYAVYSGPYPTLGRALKMLEAVRGRGYVSAYTRRLGR
jgi:uncharacterized protein (UPF0548 family)